MFGARGAALGWRHGTAIRLILLGLAGLVAFWIEPVLGVVVIVLGGFLLRTAMERCDNQGRLGDDVVSETGDGGMTADIQLEGSSLDDTIRHRSRGRPFVR